MDFDVVIVGAGPAGLSFARLLADSGLAIALIDRQTLSGLASPEFDGRDIALTHQSRRILQSIGVWPRFDARSVSPIAAARVEDGTSPYSLEFDPAADEPDVLGFIVSNHLIREALFEEVRNLDNVSFFCDTAVSDLKTDADHGATVVLSDGRNLRSRLIVAADSRFSETRRMMGIAASMYDFGRVCVVCRVQNERPHHGVAYECFHYGRTLAVLPLSGNCSSVVITAPMDERAAILEMESEPFSRDLESRFGGRLGRMQLTSERFAYPLVGVHSNHFVATRFALIGDAAVGMHPVTAHGYNLGLGGAEILASEITRSAERGEDIGAAPLLSRYESKHMRKTIPMYRGTNEMVRFFTDDRGPLKVARQIALRLSNNFPPVKRAIRSMLTEKDTSGGLLPLFFPRPPFLSRPSLSIRSNRRHEFETD